MQKASLEFFPPLLVRNDEKSIALKNVDEAILYLHACPHGRRDEGWVSALRCCEYSRDGLMGTPSARRSLDSWAEKSGVKVLGTH